ncbi:D-alanyl-D-alanine carboxypeptidase family protein [Rhodoferax antarcticus]|uniref:serine-type D-Ala-D-Ala carboxypeptidase n=1 Tax=Rhodoferax antarcticus ANT.BR TaxID=1111071 RepID=A0A1Q8YIS7_9BURK|nr:D-alanyl-D-alanine carboxypeptidase family protein [Rhodoferax antarcticus]APW48582.1 peptidase [Rhodoferax antarcticus]MCW2313466.1 D-alanyl-D-alanine carboxypeptidase (penicillin-binding protein 5/6) [Rhodoferax antarcticus]OLP07895.1 D-alanyl-D-alanine carboxypeptidase family protein [Rhodoferax antarcticus ANT.BR]
MKKILVTLVAWVALSVAAQTPQTPEIAARSYLLLDVTANQILAQKDIDMAIEPASLTKLMTAYLVFDALRNKKIDLKQTLPVSERAWKMPGSRMFIDPKMQVPVEDLIKGMIVQSGNDATIALAEGVGGSVERFVEMMNAQAKVLGMTSTGYKNPEGLTAAGHTTSARDLSVLATRLMRDFPDYVAYYAIKKYRYPGTPAANDNNRNALLFRDPTVDGLKTGYTDAAGYCLVATAHRDVSGVGNRRLLSVMLGTASENARANESQKLLNWGYTAFEAVKLFDGNQPVVTPAVWKGTSATVALGQPQPIVVAVPAGTRAKLTTEVARPEPLVAPLTKWQPIGTLKVSSEGRLVAEVPLLALQGVDEAGVLGRAWDSLRLWIK